MRLVFAGTPEFAGVALASLLAAGHEIVLVLTQPDRPAGRGLQLLPCPVKRVALAHGLPLAQPRSLRLDGNYPDQARIAQAALHEARAQAMVVVAYGLILPRWVLDAMREPRPDQPGLGCFNIHASLLPRWRGAAPIHRAIEAGDASTGVTIMRMDVGLDTGDMLLSEAVDIQPDDSTGRLHGTLAALGGQLMVQALARSEQGTLSAQPQPSEGVCYAHKVDKAEAHINWNADAATIERRLRAFDPAPGAWTRMGDQVVKLWRASIGGGPGNGASAPGTLLQADAGGIRVACGGHGSLWLRELQRAGGKRLDAASFVRGVVWQAGMRFDIPAA